jgi:hypothetical protein
MGYTGTRERIYQARTPAEAIDGMEDELNAMGWVPLARERRTDGSLRVIYERALDAAADEGLGQRSVPRGHPIRIAVAMAIAVVTIMCAIVVVAWSGLAFLTMQS